MLSDLVTGALAAFQSSSEGALDFAALSEYVSPEDVGISTVSLIDVFAGRIGAAGVAGVFGLELVGFASEEFAMCVPFERSGLVLVGP